MKLLKTSGEVSETIPIKNFELGPQSKYVLHPENC